MPTADEDGTRLVIENAFGKLEIEDIDEAEFDAMPDAVVKTGDNKKTSVKYEAEDVGSDWIYGLHCLFEDIHDLMEYVKDLWSFYLDGELDIAAASVATNTSIDLVRRMEREFLKGTKVPSSTKKPG